MTNKKQKRRCEGQRLDGAPCGMHPMRGSKLCFNHNPKRARARAEARKKGGQNGRRSKVATKDVDSIRLRTVEDVQDLLEGVVVDTLGLDNGNQRSRTLGTLLQIALKALEVGEHEERIKALEDLIAAGAP